ncbi:condensation domain-containing protein [Amycolatopsis aidingensis]|uniref:condensation domain-containing protein n=1 Tax=Amycolatopsis aidingensis TaxID=2842453 RepID=UPI001C0AE56D|nr:condensation domain-containing protein [Amycolatopsis aidingensis]
MTAAQGQAFPASYAQQGMWLSSSLVPDTPLYLLGVDYRLPYRVTAEQLTAALAEIVRRHETLRTALCLREGTLVQVVYPPASPELPVEDRTELPPPERAREVRRLLAAEAGTPLELDRPPLWRARLVRCAATEWHLIFVAHHAVLDATSIFNLRRELHELCRAAAEGTRPLLPDLPIQYADFSAWQRDQVTGPAAEGQLRFWRTRLAGLPETHSLPTDHPRPPRATHRGAQVRFSVPAELAAAVRAYGGQHGASPFMVLLAAFQAVLARLSGEPDTVVGTPVAGRDLPELGPLIGMFVNTLVLRTDLSGDPSFAEIVRRARETALSAWEHQRTPFDLLVESLAPRRDPGRHPLFQLGFNFLPDRGYAGGGNEVASMGMDDEDTPATTARFDLHLDLFEQDGGLVGVLEYATDLFEAASVRAIAGHYTRVLAAGVAGPDTPLSRLPMLGEAQQRRLVAAARPEGAVPEQPVWSRFAAVARQRAAEPAVSGGHGSGLSYAELAGAAAALGERLAAGGTAPVALLPGAGAAPLATGVLAALYAGRPFLLLAADLPAARLGFLVRNTGIGTLVAAAGLALPPVEVPVLAADQHAPPSTGEPVRRPPGAAAWLCGLPARTGLPKQAVLTGLGLAAGVRALGDLLRPEPGERIGLAPAQPDALLVPMLLAGLLAGATLHRLDPDDSARVDQLAVTESTVDLLGGLRPERTLLVDGGPELPLPECPPDVRLVRRFGFAECAGAGPLLTGTEPAVLTPGPLVGACVLDARAEPAAEGALGELCLTGPTVAAGYLGRPGPSAERFLPDPYAQRPGSRLLRTGLPARSRPDGTIEIRTTKAAR